MSLSHPRVRSVMLAAEAATRVLCCLVSGPRPVVPLHCSRALSPSQVREAHGGVHLLVVEEPLLYQHLGELGPVTEPNVTHIITEKRMMR